MNREYLLHIQICGLLHHRLLFLGKKLAQLRHRKLPQKAAAVWWQCWGSQISNEAALTQWDGQSSIRAKCQQCESNSPRRSAWMRPSAHTSPTAGVDHGLNATSMQAAGEWTQLYWFHMLCFSCASVQWKRVTVDDMKPAAAVFCLLSECEGWILKAYNRFR